MFICQEVLFLGLHSIPSADVIGRDRQRIYYYNKKDDYVNETRSFFNGKFSHLFCHHSIALSTVTMSSLNPIENPRSKPSPGQLRTFRKQPEKNYLEKLDVNVHVEKCDLLSFQKLPGKTQFTRNCR